MIVATAGHIDHGKTALVKAMTGVDADRLPEEKKRGLSIDLGYAFLPLEDGHTLGFVDVPGHERFIRNMLAGVIGVDCALLVVAAVDGPMPQTIEHLAILDLLGITRGAVALTKIDCVSQSRVAEVNQDIATMVSQTSLKDAVIFPVSALTGEGVPALADHLAASVRENPCAASGGYFRLAIDRVFTLKGAGQIVTGTVHSGQVRVGDRLVLSQSGAVGRARGIHAQNREVRQAGRGERCALNITGAGLKRVQIRRGDWLLASASAGLVSRLDARVRLLSDETPISRLGVPVHVHLGAADVPGRIASIQQRSIAPGGSGFARLTLERPIHALWGDRLILRDQSARRTIAGGQVIDPFAPAHGRAKAERLDLLAAMEVIDRGDAMRRLLEMSPAGVLFDEFARARNLDVAETTSVLGDSRARLAGNEGERRAFSISNWSGLSGEVVAAIEHFHEARPTDDGPGQSDICRLLKMRLPAAVITAILDELVGEGVVMRSGNQFQMPLFKPQVAAHETALLRQVISSLRAAEPHAPGISELAGSLRVDAAAVNQCLRFAARQGLVIECSDGRYLLTERVHALASVAKEFADASPEQTFTVRAFSDRAGIGRNFTIQILEHFDRTGLTRRVGDARQVLNFDDSMFSPSPDVEIDELGTNSEIR